jgi:hypothetical protein
VTTLVAAGAGFLLAVLWFDLMFDLQARAHRAEVPEPALASIAAYYARVTTGASPMNRLVAVAMVVTLAGIVAEIADDEVRGWIAWTSLSLALPAFAVAGLRTFPAAVRLGSRVDSAAEQGDLARAILRDHLLCLSLIAALLTLQLVEAL